jgi:hypothetical protein
VSSTWRTCEFRHVQMHATSTTQRRRRVDRGIGWHVNYSKDIFANVVVEVGVNGIFDSGVALGHQTNAVVWTGSIDGVTVDGGVLVGGGWWLKCRECGRSPREEHSAAVYDRIDAVWEEARSVPTRRRAVPLRSKKRVPIDFWLGFSFGVFRSFRCRPLVHFYDSAMLALSQRPLFRENSAYV